MACFRRTLDACTNSVAAAQKSREHRFPFFATQLRKRRRFSSFWNSRGPTSRDRALESHSERASDSRQRSLLINVFFRQKTGSDCGAKMQIPRGLLIPADSWKGGNFMPTGERSRLPLGRFSQSHRRLFLDNTNVVNESYRRIVPLFLILLLAEIRIALK